MTFDMKNLTSVGDHLVCSQLNDLISTNMTFDMENATSVGDHFVSPQLNDLFNNNMTFDTENVTSTVDLFAASQLRGAVLNANSCILIVLALAGIPTNVLNIITFVKLGLHSSTNISFAALAIADLVCACVFLFVAVIMLDTAGMWRLPVNIDDLQYLFVPVIMCATTFGSGVTALINVERCCGVFFPLKLRLMFTRNSTVCLIAAMLVSQLAIIAFNFASINLTLTMPSSARRYKVLINDTQVGNTMYIPSLFWGSSMVATACFVIIVVSTICLSISLKQRRRWLKELPGLRNEVLEKNRKLVGKVISISVIYIICFLPGVAAIFVFFASPGLNPFSPEYKNLSHVMASFIRNFQAFSGTANIFIYWKMNSKYRKCVKQILCFGCARCRASCP
ncbi:chemosensory receptor A [Elysia marginata]|uniref:Chemosensory receptor A n=1 Tax=Elysia marginata TaxID=1093978 RepID=A0AAV4JSL8_9GAST|nr:chemosensory receptor A [Elysia marginata]